MRDGETYSKGGVAGDEGRVRKGARQMRLKKRIGAEDVHHPCERKHLRSTRALGTGAASGAGVEARTLTARQTTFQYEFSVGESRMLRHRACGQWISTTGEASSMRLLMPAKRSRRRRRHAKTRWS